MGKPSRDKGRRGESAAKHLLADRDYQTNRKRGDVYGWLKD